MIKKLPPCPHCGGSFFWDEEDNEIRCINCGRPLNSDNHNGEVESLQSTVQQKCLQPCSESKSSMVKLGGEGNTPQADTPIPEKPLKSLRIVPDKEWYPPYEITFQRSHILFILRHLESLREGVYPPDPYHSGYTDTPMPKKQKRARHRAYFETPVAIAAEVERRLENCGLDGVMLLLLYTYSWPEETVAKYYRISAEEVKFRAGAVLYRISGWSYKARPYRRWHASRDWRNQREKRRAFASANSMAPPMYDT